jgi:preprotein translocase subunit SecF
MNLEKFYGNYKALMIIPILMLIFSLITIGVTYSNTGDVMYKDISLKGGVTITLYKEGITDLSGLQSYLTEKFGEVNVRELTDFSTQKKVGVIIEAPDVKEEDLKIALKEKLTFNEGDYSSETVGSALSDAFYKQLVTALMLSFILMGIVVFIIFRKLVPSLAVIISAFLDIVVTLAITNLMGLKISTAGISAFLLLIGYSVGTDMLLTTKVLKHKTFSSVIENIRIAINTGTMMILTTIAALIAGIVFTNSEIISGMFTILVIGLIVDMISTWVMNAALLIWHMKSKGLN